jgi:hypothetical protein
MKAVFGSNRKIRYKVCPAPPPLGTGQFRVSGSESQGTKDTATTAEILHDLRELRGQVLLAPAANADFFTGSEFPILIFASPSGFDVRGLQVFV